MKSLLLRIGFCLGVFGLCLYSYLEAQNELTELKMQLPQKEREIALIREEARRLAYQVEQMESPAALIEQARRPEFSHLKHPLLKEILTVPEVFASN
jgi:cell division protein FtsB